MGRRDDFLAREAWTAELRICGRSRVQVAPVFFQPQVLLVPPDLANNDEHSPQGGPRQNSFTGLQ